MRKRVILLAAFLLAALASVHTAGAAVAHPADAKARLAAETESAAAVAARLTRLHQAKQWPEVSKLLDELFAGDREFAAEVISIPLKNPQIETRTHLISDVRRAGLVEIVPTLVALLNDSQRGVRTHSAAALGRLGDRRAVGPLRRALGAEKDVRVHHQIRAALALLGESYVGYCIAGLTDRDVTRRSGCVHTLGTLKDKRAVPHLLKIFEESTETWEPIRAAEALTEITGIENSVVIETIERADGGVTTRTKRRPADEFKQDCRAWIAQHRDEVSSPVEVPREPWEYTPEPLLPGLNVAFTMDASQVMDVYRKAGLECRHHAEKRWEKDGTKFRSRESIEAAESCLDSLNVGLVGIHYVFKDNRLEEVRFVRTLHRRPIVGPLVEPLKLQKRKAGCWWGLDETIVVNWGRGDAEKLEFIIRLRRYSETDR